MKRLVVIDLKLQEFKLEQKWQLELYLRWLNKCEKIEGDKIIGAESGIKAFNLEGINIVVSDEGIMSIADETVVKVSKEDLIKNNNISSAIFLLDQKVEPLEFLNRLKVIALEFNGLTDREKPILKHWLKDTVDETIAEDAVKILEYRNEEVEKMVANNAFMIEEMKQKVRKETQKEIKKNEEELIKQDRIEIAKNLMDTLDDETISLKLGLTINEVKKIRNVSNSKDI